MFLPNDLDTQLLLSLRWLSAGERLSDSENQHTWKTVRLGKIVEGGQFEIVWSSEKPIRPEPYPSSRPAAAWDEFLTGLYREWDGHWTKSQN